MDKIAVVILNWNGCDMLRSFLPSVVRFSEADGAVVYVADNGSTDDSVAMLHREFPSVRQILLDQNYGFADGYNLALRQVNAEYAVLLNSDVEVTEHWLLPLAEYMDTHPDTAACQPKIRSWRNKGRFEYAGAAGGFIDCYGYPFCRGRIMGVVEEDRGQYDTVLPIFWATGAALFIRLDDYREAGGLDGRFFAHMEEIDLCWRLRARGRRLVCVPQSVVFHVGGATLKKENPRKTFLNFRNNLLMLYKNLPPEELKSVMRVRAVLDYVAALSFGLKGQFPNAWAVLRARHAYHSLRASFTASREENLERATLADIPERKGSSILVQFYVRGKKYFSQLLPILILSLLCSLSACRMNKAERAEEVHEDSVTTVTMRPDAGSDSLGTEATGGGSYSHDQLLAIHTELSKRLANTTYTHIQRNVTGYGIGMSQIDIDLMVNTPERRKEFREKIMDSPVFCFHGAEVPVVNERIGKNHVRGIHIRPEYPVFSTQAAQATFILSNHSGGDLTCGEHYYITFEDEKGTWRELPINAAFWDIAYVLRDGEERSMKASLYPDVHPNKLGRYRYFYEITIRRKPVLMMAEFRLTDKEKEWRSAEKTSLPPYISEAGKNGTSSLLEEEPMEEPVYKVVEVMPEFPGGMKALMDFIQKNMHYPEEARKNGVQGRVTVSVVIDENGRATDPVIMRSRHTALDKEALRIAGLMPLWKPGMQQGKAVKVEFTFPVTFRLTDD